MDKHDKPARIVTPAGARLAEAAGFFVEGVAASMGKTLEPALGEEPHAQAFNRGATLSRIMRLARGVIR